MFDPATISTVLTSIKTAADIAKLIKESGSSFEQAELKLKLADLISSLADAKIEIATIQLGLQEKDALIAALEKQLKTQKEVEWEEPYYWKVSDGTRDGPYCQKCYDDDVKLVRLQGDDEGYWECRVCKSHYLDKAGKAKFRQPVERKGYNPYSNF